MKRTSDQANAFDRLRGEPVPEPKISHAAWSRLESAVIEALRFADITMGLEIGELEALFDQSTRGINAGGWVNPYPKDDPRSLLKQYQFNSFHDQNQFQMDIWSRQTGKDFTLAGVAATDGFQRKTQWTVAAPSERQSLESLEKAKDWALAFGDLITDFHEDRERPEALIKSAMITLRNGSRIRAVPGMPHTVRGLTSNVGITEADFLEQPKETMRALLGSLANEEAGRKSLRLITTPNGKNGMTWKIWNDPTSLYSKRLVTIWHAVLHGLKQNPRVLEKALDDPEGWAQEFLCQWLDGSAVLLPYELIGSCESFEASENDTPEMLDISPLRKVAGIDFGRVSDPTVMVTAVQGLDISMVRNIKSLRGMSTPDQIDTLHPFMRLCDRICVDYTGPGIGFGDLAVKAFGKWDPENHQFGKIELCTFTLPFKRQIFPDLRVAFEKRLLRIPVSAWLREDLHAMAQVISGGQYNYKAPRSDEGHSDGCTALALMRRAAGQGSGVVAFGSTPRSPGRLEGPGLLEGMRRFIGRMSGG
jgi:phage FluMu gp28-like protein